MTRRIFVDSDVIISALLSATGAASLLLREKSLSRFISSFSVQEISIVSQCLAIAENKFTQLLPASLTEVQLKDSLSVIKKQYALYVTHENDAHVVAGAVVARAQFFITYNLRHYRRDNLKTDLKILVISPGTFLQYLRSQA